MPRPPRARQPLIQAALRILVEEGLDALSMRKLANEAGCTEGAIYRHWVGKEELIKDLFRRELEGITNVLKDALNDDSAGDLSDRLGNAVRAGYAYYDENPLGFRLTVLVQHDQAANLPDDLILPQDLLAKFLKRHLSQDQDEYRAAFMGAAMLGVFLQVAEQVINGRLPGPMSKHTDDVIEIVRAIAQ